VGNGSNLGTFNPRPINLFVIFLQVLLPHFFETRLAVQEVTIQSQATHLLLSINVPNVYLRCDRTYHYSLQHHLQIENSRTKNKKRLFYPPKGPQSPKRIYLLRSVMWVFCFVQFCSTIDQHKQCSSALLLAILSFALSELNILHIMIN